METNDFVGVAVETAERVTLKLELQEIEVILAEADKPINLAYRTAVQDELFIALQTLVDHSTGIPRTQRFAWSYQYSDFAFINRIVQHSKDSKSGDLKRYLSACFVMRQKSIFLGN